MRLCEIIYVKEKSAKGWKWRPVVAQDGKTKASESTYELFYECIAAARAQGYQPPNLKCL